MHYTANYHLPTWEKSDRIRMDDFNDMTAKLEASLAAEQQARLSGDAGGSDAVAAANARIDLCGNCKIATFAYQGTGEYGYGKPTSFTFPGPPLVVFWGMANGNGVSLRAVRGQTMVYCDSGADFPVNVVWNGNTVGLEHSQSASGQFNIKDCPYRVVALIAADE